MSTGRCIPRRRCCTRAFIFRSAVRRSDDATRIVALCLVSA